MAPCSLFCPRIKMPDRGFAAQPEDAYRIHALVQAVQPIGDEKLRPARQARAVFRQCMAFSSDFSLISEANQIPGTVL